MITNDNLLQVLNKLNFKKDNDFIYKKQYLNNIFIMVDFKNRKIIFPEQIKLHDKTTSNFEKNENFVVLECIDRLLTKGYDPNHIELEPKYKLGRESKSSGKADILVKDKLGESYILIECKTYKTKVDAKGSEFENEWNNMLKDGGQLLSYFRQNKKVKFLCLYTSDFINDEIYYFNYILNMQDNELYLKENDYKLSYISASDENEIFKVWKEIYQQNYLTSGIFESDINPYEAGKLSLKFTDLKEFDHQNNSLYNDFATILRQHNISGKENAFDKLVNLFLCKIYDETFNKNNLEFKYRGIMADTYESLQDRLMKLYKNAMKEFLNEDITYVENANIEDVFNTTSRSKKSMQSMQEQIQDYIRQLKFYSNNDFAFLEVHNKDLFYKNAIVLKNIVRLFEDIRLTENKVQQFLGNLFELFLQKGMKQDEGQFFTPIQICEFIMHSLPIDNINKPLRVIDYACGAGHFLNTYASFIEKQINDKEKLKEYYKNIYGIEKEYRLSKVAKVSASMYGQNEINIFYADALASNENIENYSFDLLIANPPYSVKGFLETLSEKDLEKYILFNKDINKDTFNSIECFFIERAIQLLNDNANAAIILPSPFLSNSNIGKYQEVRELIFQNFDIKAIVELPSGTFGATGTNTIILFLHKLKTYDKDKDLGLTSSSIKFKTLQDRLKASNLIDDDNFVDNGYIDEYVAFRGIKKDIFIDLINENYTDELLECFQDYLDDFYKSNIYKKLTKSKVYKDSTIKEDLENGIFIEFVKNIENKKLIYFSMIKDNKLIIVKAPDKNDEKKKFLGYQWSTDKDDPGLRELNDPYNTPLYDKNNINNDEKISYKIKELFLNNEIIINDELSKYVSYEKNYNLIDFKNANFNLKININLTNSHNHVEYFWKNSKYPIISIKECVNDIINGSTPLKSQNKYWDKKDIQWLTIPDFTNSIYINETKDYISQLAVDEKKVKIVPKNSVLLSCTATIGKCAINKDILTTNQQINALVCKLDKVIPEYLVYIFRMYSNELENLASKSSVKYINVSTLSSFQIPLPPLDVQEQIVKECEEVNKQFETIRMSIEEYKRLISEILSKVGIISSNGGGDLRVELLKFLGISLDFIDDLSNILINNKKLGQICKVLIGGTPSRKNHLYYGGNNLWVSIAEMNGNIISDTKEKITELGVKESNVKLIPSGTTLLSFKLSIGKVALAGADLYTNEAIAGLIPKDKNIVLDKYLFYLFKNKVIDLDLKNKNTFGTSLNSQILKDEVEIPLIPIDKQKLLINIIDKIENKIYELEKDINDKNNIINKILAKYIY
ncbi:restriction endonuclease subunit S [Campylobacter sp. RM12637]|uniref:restriction endonuclease subunit S n=1 Tax=Campylobacter sp. RM12637 TaxID=2735734 RepID=UPI0030151CE4|nr:N-6 DNA methylase [Campylobacter sp. RM12637]